MDVGNIVSPFQSQAGGPQGAAPGQTGSFAGVKVSVNDPMSLVMNSAEEASFAMSEREEARLEERKMKAKGPSTERVEQVEKYLELMDKQGKQKPLESFISALAAKSDLDPGQALDEASKFFSDAGDAYAALQYAREELGDKFGEALFTEAMDQLEDLHGKDIQTRLAAGVAALEHPDLGDADGLKDLYQETLGDLGSPVDIFERIMADYGEDRFGESLDFLTRSLGNSMAATTIYTDRVQLETIGRDLGQVQLLHGLNAQCKGLTQRITQSQGRCDLNATEMVKEILKLRDAHFVGAFDIEGIADRVGVSEIEDRIGFFQDFSNTARQISENLFPDPAGRLNLIEAIQAALDDAIAIEEEMYE